MTNYDLIIIGAGPAGLTAAIYASRAKLRVLVIDKSTAGGQVKTTHQVANFPGFVEPIPGYKLAQNMYKQAQLYGTEFKLISNIKELYLTPKEKWVTLTSGEKFEAPFFILATGRSPRLLNLPGEKELAGNGISYCATCDGDFYKGKDIFVIGGGNSAMEESLLLLQLVNSITVIHQFDELQAEKITAEKVTSNPKATFMYSHEPRKFEAVGDKIAVEIENLKTHEHVTLERDGVFIFVGMIPNNELIKGTDVKLNKYGYISINEQTMETNIPGVYAAGDIRDKFQWQITTAVSDGTIAALNIIKHR
ncbi:MAG: FAD-dependent oxidoreductase [Candidatus Lokiarchaeota archaeon]|nr:FAD-dependent oxidoreductase [Candidatus Harpocratesius repetitus]